MNDNNLLRYARQIVLDGWDIDAQLRLADSRVLMIGAGGLGCPVAQTLVRTGLGNLHIMDDDVIELSNLPRQSLFFDDDVGNSKSEILAKHLRLHNPACNLSYAIQRLSASDVEICKQFDLIIDCSDNFATRDLLNIASITCNVPLLSGSAIAQVGQIALFEPNKTACYHCLFDPSETSDNRRCADTGVLASTTAIIGNLQAQVALQFLGLGINPLANTLLIWQGETISLKKLTFTKNPQCKTCGKLL